jgi:hypothetical protein
MYENAQYVGRETIKVDINGVTCFVPVNLENSDYAAIMALVAEGKLTIGAAE